MRSLCSSGISPACTERLELAQPSARAASRASGDSSQASRGDFGLVRVATPRSGSWLERDRDGRAWRDIQDSRTSVRRAGSRDARALVNGKRDLQWRFPSYRSGRDCARPEGGHIPLWLGGRADVVLRRAARIADGFMPQQLTPDQIAPFMDRVTGILAEEGREVDRFG